MIKLHRYSPLWGLPDLSTFCTKVDAYLRMAEIPYEPVIMPLIEVWAKAPKGKLPFIEDGDTRLADSAFIVDHLKSKYGDKLDAGLTPAERGLGLAIRRLGEDSLYWVLIYARWVDEKAWPQYKQIIEGALPPEHKAVAEVILDATKKQLHGQGMLRHSEDEIYAIGRENLQALSALLGDKPYFLGNTPTSVDASIWALLAHAYGVPYETQIRADAQKFTNLQKYVDRIKDKYYPA